MNIILDSVSVSLGGQVILKDIHLDLEPGKIHVVVGPNGAGKTTLLRVLGLLQPLHSGELRFEERNAWKLNHARRKQLRQRIGFVFQHPHFFQGSVAYNLSFGLKARGLNPQAEELQEWLVRVGLQADLLYQETRKLSGGEQQKLQLARVMAFRPDFIILDEPSSNLDPVSARSTENLIKGMVNGSTTVILATHHLIQAWRLANQIIYLNQGKVLFQGTPQEFFSKPFSMDAAEFLSSENIMSGNLKTKAGKTVFQVGRLQFEVATRLPSGKAHAIIKPEDILLSPEPLASSARNSFQGRIHSIQRIGPIVHIQIDCQGILFTVWLTPQSLEGMHLTVDGQVVLTFKATAVHLIPT